MEEVGASAQHSAPARHVYSVRLEDRLAVHTALLVQRIRGGAKPSAEAAKKWRMYATRPDGASTACLDAALSFKQNGVAAGDTVYLMREVAKAKAKAEVEDVTQLSTQRTTGGCSGSKKVFFFARLGADVAVAQRWRANGAGTGSITWDAAFVLAALLDVRLAEARPDTVVELGAGVGLPSVLAVHHGCKRVLATDGDSAVMPLLEANMAAAAAASDNPVTAEAAFFRWDDEVARGTLVGKVQGRLLVVCADILYRGSHKYWEDLAATLWALLVRGAQGTEGAEAADADVCTATCLLAATERGTLDCVDAFLSVCRTFFADRGEGMHVAEIAPVPVACVLPQKTRIFEISSGALGP